VGAWTWPELMADSLQMILIDVLAIWAGFAVLESIYYQ
jgi:hypothetical protein